MPISRRATSRLIAAATLSGLLPAQASAKLVIMTRAEWGAKPPIMAMRDNVPDRLTIHHTATRQNRKHTLASKLQNLQAFSQKDSRLADGRLKKAWADVPYHYYVDVDGAVAEGREVRFVGDTNTNYDPAGHITIVVEGNFEVEQPTPAQIATLEELLTELARRYSIPAERISYHRAFAQTACPGKNMIARMAEIQAEVAKRLTQ